MRNLLLLLVLLSTVAYGQKMEPVKDNVSKLYGYKKNKYDSRWIIAPQFEIAEYPMHGYAKAKKDKLWGLYDSTGNIVVPHQFEEMTKLNFGMFWAKAGEQSCLYNIKLEKITCNAEWKNVKIVTPDRVVALHKELGKNGLFTIKGEMLLPYKYSFIDEQNDFVQAAIDSENENPENFSTTLYVFDKTLKQQFSIPKIKNFLPTINGITPVSYSNYSIPKIILINLEGKPLHKDTLHDAIIEKNFIIAAKGTLKKYNKEEDVEDYDDYGYGYSVTDVVLKDKKYGIMSYAGKWLLAPKYDNIQLSKNTLYYYEKKNKTSVAGILNKTTFQPLIPATRYDFLEPAGKGYYQVGMQLEENYVYGLIDGKNKEVIPAKYHLLKIHDEKLVIATDKKGYKYESGVYTLNGKLLIPVKYATVDVLENDIVKFGNNEFGANAKYGFTYPDGSFTIDSCGYIGNHKQWLSFNKNNKAWLFSIKEKKNILRKDYDHIGPVLNDNYFPVRKEKKYGFVDSTGNEVIACQWGYATYFSDDLASVRDENFKYGYINRKGELVIPCKFSSASNFIKGKATVTLNGKKIQIDKQGNEIKGG